MFWKSLVKSSVLLSFLPFIGKTLINHLWALDKARTLKIVRGQSSFCVSGCVMDNMGCSVANPDASTGSPPMVSGLSGFGVSKQNRKFLKSYLMLNIIFKHHSIHSNYSLPSRNTDIACGRLRVSGFLVYANGSLGHSSNYIYPYFTITQNDNRNSIHHHSYQCINHYLHPDHHTVWLQTNWVLWLQVQYRWPALVRPPSAQREANRGVEHDDAGHIRHIIYILTPCIQPLYLIAYTACAHSP